MNDAACQPENIQLKWLEPEHIAQVSTFLQQLPLEVKARFAPHAFDEATLQKLFCENAGECMALLAFAADETLIAYHLIRKGFLLNEAPRLASYGLLLNAATDYTYAPVQAPHFQGAGLGSRMWRTIANRLQQLGVRRVFLWGGVQLTNIPAIKFYQKNGFLELGRFHWEGENADMQYRFQESVSG